MRSRFQAAELVRLGSEHQRVATLGGVVGVLTERGRRRVLARRFPWPRGRSSGSWRPSACSLSITSIAGESRTSSVLGLKLSPSTPISLPEISPTPSRTFSTIRVRCAALTWSTAETMRCSNAELATEGDQRRGVLGKARTAEAGTVRRHRHAAPGAARAAALVPSGPAARTPRGPAERAPRALARRRDACLVGQRRRSGSR